MAGEVISISLAGWERSLALYMQALGKGLHETLTEEWPLLVRKVMDFTPPFQSGGGSGSSDLSVGRAAVNRDIRKTMRPFAPVPRTWKLAKIISQRDIALFNIIAAKRKRGPMAGARAVVFSPTVHTSQRNARGRVGKTLGNVVLGTDSKLLLDYIKKVQSQVGIAKAGWWPALALAGGKAPAFVTKHGLGFGSYIDERTNADDPSLTAINRTPWAVRKDEAQRIVNSALASRAKAIVSKTRTKLRLAAKAAQIAAVA